MDWVVALQPGADLDGFRRAARGLVAAEAAPAAVDWSGQGLFGQAPPDGQPLRLPRRAGALIQSCVRHADPERFALLYQLVWRVHRGERALAEIASDPLVHRLEQMDKAVRREIHKMHAFVRFRRIDGEADERFIAWFEPEHFVLEAAAPFFVDRFRSMRWSILTPLGSVFWDGTALDFGPPARREDAPDKDAFEDGWRAYFESTFNPARVNPRMMASEMPRRYWPNLPEAAAIPEMIRGAPARVREMIEREASAPMKRNPDKAVAAMADQAPKTLDELNCIIAASDPFVTGGTRAVLGEGPLNPPIALVGEQPGDQEDVQGRPFVGPAGQLLDRALAEAGLDRADLYVTNAVKHFKFVQQGKRRLHKSPTAGEVKHYRWWLDKELELVRPRVIVAMGATAVLALAGKPLPITKCRGEASFENRRGVITWHPSYLLRVPDAGRKEEAWRQFVGDLRLARELAA
jgi:uracil-DNA glycosylase